MRRVGEDDATRQYTDELAASLIPSARRVHVAQSAQPASDSDHSLSSELELDLAPPPQLAAEPTSKSASPASTVPAGMPQPVAHAPPEVELAAAPPSGPPLELEFSAPADAGPELELDVAAAGTEAGSYEAARSAGMPEPHELGTSSVPPPLEVAASSYPPPSLELASEGEPSSRRFSQPVQPDAAGSDPSRPEQPTPSASGTLARRPFSHLLLYMFDRGLSGTLVLQAADGSVDRHAVTIDGGNPIKAVVSRRVPSLAMLLVQEGLIEEATLSTIGAQKDPDATLETKLLDQGLIDESELSRVRGAQLLMRLESLFSLPAETAYHFYAGVDMLEKRWGSVAGSISLFAALARGLRENPEEAIAESMLRRLARTPVRLHPRADLSLFSFTNDELGVAEAIRREAASLPQLLEVFPRPAVVRRVIYLLLVSRNLVLAKS